VKLPWRRADGPKPRALGRPGVASDAPEVLRCPSLSRALDRVGKRDKPEILDLGPLCGATAVFLAQRGARVTVEDFEPPPPTPGVRPGEEAPSPPPIVIRQDDARFDLVLAWEHADFTPPDRIAELASELARVLAPEGVLLLFAANPRGAKSPRPDRPGRFRIVAADRLVREETGGAARPRWTHPNRDIERALAPLSILGVHLQRSQTREFLAAKRL